MMKPSVVGVYHFSQTYDYTIKPVSLYFFLLIALSYKWQLTMLTHKY